MKAQREQDLAMVTAWHTAVFALNGYSGKLKGKSLSDFIGRHKETVSKTAQAVAFFHGLKSRGFPVEITRVERPGGSLQ